MNKTQNKGDKGNLLATKYVFFFTQAISFMYALIFKSISYSITSVSIHILILDTKKEYMFIQMKVNLLLFMSMAM